MFKVYMTDSVVFLTQYEINSYIRKGYVLLEFEGSYILMKGM